MALEEDQPPRLDQFEGCLLGLMLGDCLGLPREGLSPRRARRLFGDEISHRFLFGRGMASDDTEHACLTAQALLGSRGDAGVFLRALAGKLRWWLLGLPAGVGWATLRSILRLWLGAPPEASGVFSAGNGPVMRSPILGLFFLRDPGRLEAFAAASTRLTHLDPRAERGALAVARAVRYGAMRARDSFSAEEVLSELSGIFPDGDGEAREWLSVVRKAVAEHWDAGRFISAMRFGDGVSGYIYHTVPAALWAWLVDPWDFAGGMGRVLRLGGDTDTAGAVFGALCGATAGAGALPAVWLEGIVEFPRTVDWVRRLARGLGNASRGGSDAPPVPLAWPWLLLRNPFFLAVVLWHGLRRMLPPY